MVRKILALAAVCLATPAMAAFTIGTGADSAIPAVNDFGTVAGPNNDLGDLGLTVLRTSASLTLSGPGTITYELLGSESGVDDRFNSLFSFTQSPDVNAFGAPIAMFSETFLTALAASGYAPFFTSGLSGFTVNHAPGSGEFGFFLPTGTSGSFSSNVVYFGYDNQITATDDDNHDDFVMRATFRSAVPEPGTWAMLLSGFAIVGSLLRRRRSNQASVLA